MFLPVRMRTLLCLCVCDCLNVCMCVGHICHCDIYACICVSLMFCVRLCVFIDVHIFRMCMRDVDIAEGIVNMDNIAGVIRVYMLYMVRAQMSPACVRL